MKDAIDKHSDAEREALDLQRQLVQIHYELAIASQGDVPRLTEAAQQIKERLDAVMDYMAEQRRVIEHSR